MKLIYKYYLTVDWEQQVSLPEGYQILSVGLDPLAKLCLWALVDPTQLNTNMTVLIAGTGIPVHDCNKVFIGSVMMNTFMWHVFVKE